MEIIFLITFMFYSQGSGDDVKSKQPDTPAVEDGEMTVEPGEIKEFQN